MATTHPLTLHDCSTCRHHVTFKRPMPLWFEAGEQMRTLDEDVDVCVCRAPAGSHTGSEFVTPIKCDAYEDGRARTVTSEATQLANEAYKRWQARRSVG